MRILLIQPEWPARALLKAELEERGHQVLGADSLRLAAELSLRRGFRPDIVVIDTMGMALEPAEVERLRFLRGRSPLLLVRSGQYGPSPTAPLDPTRELVRPVTVGEIADAVAALASPR